jgi:microcystin-dependent protein
MRTRQMFPNILRSLRLSVALIGALASSAFAQPSGGSRPHENIQPVLALNYIIALQGIFPSRG